MDSSLNKNIILNQLLIKGKTIQIKEVSPFLNGIPPFVLCLNENMDLCWNSFPIYKIEAGKGIDISINSLGIIKIEASINFPPLQSSFIENNKIKDTEIYWDNGQMGIGRHPLLSYHLDIAVSENLVSTAFHIGDGISGFSMGNGTNEGFLPEIIGMGKDEHDAGLYLLGRAGNNVSSNIPLIVIDGRSNSDTKILNRPIFGITSAKYDDYKMIINHNGDIGIGKIPQIYKLEVNGKIGAEDLILNEFSILSLIDIIKNHENEISRLKDEIKNIRNKTKK